MSDSVIRLTDASVSYRNAVVLDSVSLSVVRGEFVGIIGPNGAGKTTLLTVVNGLTRLAQGEACVLGEEPERSGAWRLRRRIGYVAQVARIDPRLPMTVRESVMAGRSGRIGLLKRPRRSDWQRVDEALGQVGIAALAERPIGQLSGGEFQRMAIARALVQEPGIFLFDEPTVSIDPRSQREILGLIEEIHEHSHVTSLYVTHDLALLPRTCRRLVLMRNGRIWREGGRDEMLTDALLQELYAGEAVAPESARPAPAVGERWT